MFGQQDAPKVPAINLTLYSRPDCHLCEKMKVTLQRVARRYPFELTEIDVSTNSELEKTYGSEIPVLMIEGQKTAHYYIREEELLQKLSKYY